jgi:pimeloyl-ACP methyl ester carboxylesterase
VLHPEWVSSLTLISCGVASSDAQDQAKANRRGDLLAALFKHDALFWAASRLFRRRFTKLMGASDAVVAGLTPEQRDLVDQVIDLMDPVSPRAAGVAFDNKAAMPNKRIAAVQAPTLIFHSRDDTLQLYRNAELAASTIPNARLVSFAQGGHLLVSVEHATLREVTRKHILDHQATPSFAVPGVATGRCSDGSFCARSTPGREVPRWDGSTARQR